MTTFKRCASGSCRKQGTKSCSKCKVTWYCSQGCQKTHWKKHKKHCCPHQGMPAGTFPFLDLPREIRDKIYEELLIARFSPEHQAEWDALAASRDQDHPPYSRRNLMDELEERLTIWPCQPMWQEYPFQPLVDVWGLLFANKQISEELTTTLFSKNRFLVPIGEGFRYQTPNQIFPCKLKMTSTSIIRKLFIDVQMELDINHPNHQNGIAAIKHNINHIVNSLNNNGNTLDYLKVRVSSTFASDAEKMRHDVDALLTHPGARPVQLVCREGQVTTLTRDNIRRFYAGAFDVGDALARLNTKIGIFQIYGDVPGEVMNRLNNKFHSDIIANAGPDTDDDHDDHNGHDGHSHTSNHRRVDRRTGQYRDPMADLMQKKADENPGDAFQADLAYRFNNMPLRSIRVRAMLFAPPTQGELERACRRAYQM